MRWEGHITCLGEMTNVYKMLVRKPEGKRLLGRHWHECECNIEMDLKEIGCKDVDWFHLIQDGVQGWALLNMVINFWVP